MKKIKVLFVCVHNSARSQMAEAFLNQLAEDEFEAESAGLEPGIMNPLVVEVMKEINIDLSGKTTKSVFEFFKQGRSYNFVISVCDEANSERCPVFVGISKRLSWSFTDPSSFDGSIEEKLAKTRWVRDCIKIEVESFIKSHHQIGY